MNPHKLLRTAASAWIILSFLHLGCGVKGRPQPPLTPAEIGRGQPTFKRATEEVTFPNLPNPNSTPVQPSNSRDGR